MHISLFPAVLLTGFFAVPLCNAQSVWEQVTGQKPPVDIHVPTVGQVLKDPVKTVVNPGSYINSTGIPIPGDFMEYVIKNPDGAIELLQNPQQWIYTPVANAIIAGRNAAIQRGAYPIPENIKQGLRRWYPNDLIDSVRWTADWGPLENTLQAAQMQFNGRTQAITLINVVIFRSADLATAANSLALWAHELVHVEQYRRWGVFGFAKAWVDNSADGGPVEGPAYARENEARRYSYANSPQIVQAGLSGGAPLPNDQLQLPPPWMRCVFPGDLVTYYVTLDNRILAIPPGAPPIFIGVRGPARYPNFAWSYQTQNVTYDVTMDGRIFWERTGQQVGFLQPP
jgi:hypothetical protein